MVTRQKKKEMLANIVVWEIQLAYEHSLLEEERDEIIRNHPNSCLKRIKEIEESEMINENLQRIGIGQNPQSLADISLQAEIISKNNPILELPIT